MLNKAIIIAAEAHSGQLDKSGKPYILHPLRVMFNVEGGITEQCTAVLHDVIEDTSVTLDDLKEQGFSDDILAALTLLTRTPNEDYMEYIYRLKINSIAKAVKLADLKDNMDMTRISSPTEKDFLRLEKYKKAKALLMNQWDN